MMRPYKRFFITRFEAVRDFIVMTILCGILFFRRDLIAVLYDLPKDDFRWNGSPTLVTALASIYYIGFLAFWSMAVYDSIKNYRKKQRNLKMLLEEQAEWRKSGGAF